MLKNMMAVKCILLSIDYNKEMKNILMVKDYCWKIRKYFAEVEWCRCYRMIKEEFLFVLCHGELSAFQDETPYWEI